MNRVKEQLNLNSIILVAIGALLTFGLKKLDDINTNVVRLNSRVDYVEQRIVNIERLVKIP